LITRVEAIKLFEETGCASNVIEHCEEVASLAYEIANKVKEKGHEINPELAYLGALLHDFGRCYTHAISHAVEGFELAKARGIDSEVAHADNLVKGTKRITIEERMALMRRNKVSKKVIKRVQKLAEEIDELSN
jgi:uncharacterized protein